MGYTPRSPICPLGATDRGCPRRRCLLPRCRPRPGSRPARSPWRWGRGSRRSRGGRPGRRRRRSSSSYRAIEPVHLVGSACGGNANGLHSPSGAHTKTAARVLPGRRIVRLHSAVGPTPLAVRIESHIGLDLDPIRARSEDRRARQVDGKGAASLRERLVGGAKNLRARKAPAVGVEEDVETSGGSGTIEVHPISIDRLDIPSLTSGHHKVVGEIGAEGREVGERRGQAGDSRSVVVLIIQNHLRSIRIRQNPKLANADGATGDCWGLLAKQGRTGIPAGNYPAGGVRQSHRARGARQIVHVRGDVCLGYRLGQASLRSVSLRQREWDRADGHKQKQIKRASEKMRFDGRVNLLFHFSVVLVRILIYSSAKTIFASGAPFLVRPAKKCQDFF